MSDINLKIEFHPLAEQDVAEAIEWYDQQSAGLGFNFLTEFDKVRILISSFPLMYPILVSDIRRAVLNRFPYKIYTNHIFIIAVMHGARHPEHWKERTTP